MLYASLIGPLLGCYYPLPFKNQNVARVALNNSKLKSLWCSVYTEEQVDEEIARSGGFKLDPVLASRLNYDYHPVAEEARALGIAI